MTTTDPPPVRSLDHRDVGDLIADVVVTRAALHAAREHVIATDDPADLDAVHDAEARVDEAEHELGEALLLLGAVDDPPEP